jgi:hypothetical protein
MLLQTNSYIVPRERRAEHARLLQRFRQTLMRLGCEHFEAYEQVGQGWASGEPTGRFVQLMRFRDKAHQQSVQAAERSDPTAQALIREFCELINFPYQQEHGLFAVGFYNDILAQTALKPPPEPQPHAQEKSVILPALSAVAANEHAEPDEAAAEMFAAEQRAVEEEAAIGDAADDPQAAVEELASRGESEGGADEVDASHDHEQAAGERPESPGA